MESRRWYHVAVAGNVPCFVRLLARHMVSGRLSGSEDGGRSSEDIRSGVKMSDKRPTHCLH